jgi:two-component system, cell cycle sensor histidine kinase and response regulator CckA
MPRPSNKKNQPNQNIFPDPHDIIEKAPIGIFTTTPEGRFIFANSAQARMLGYRSPDELIASITDIATQVYADPAGREGFKRFMESQDHMINHETRFRRRDGSLFWVLVNARALKDGNGVIVAYQGFNQDITERKQALETLRESEEKYRRLVEDQNDVFFATDENGRITYMSPSMESISGYKPEKLLERDFTSLIYSGDIPCPRETFMREILTGERKLHEFRIISTSGELVWVRCSFKTMRINSRAAGLRGVLTDKSELSRLRLYFEKVQRVEVTGKCAAALAHEMKNLMAIIIGYSGFLLSSNPKKNFLRGDVIKIKDAGVKAERTFSKLLAFGRGQSFMPVILNINEVVHEMYDFIIPVIGKEIMVNISLDPGISSVEMDRSSLERIIINLVLNAKDAMPEGGYLSIETQNVQFEQAAFPDDQLSVSGPHVMLKISDTGTGMDQMTRFRVFEPFFSTKEPGIGTGLGLSSVYDSVIQASGRILVDSEPGEGSAFRVYLPVIES